ncbi:hypothetical protein BC828DRAFT_375155 [Blastocladiella britannica]|nr:hypothetical protein BC828DRAFT_375155 [Blastocladiella britannica]
MRTTSIVLVLVLYLSTVALAAADLPAPSVWCALSTCPVVPPNLVAQANADAIKYFGPGASGTCGDGVCDTSRLETCRTCPSDCGTCRTSFAASQCTRPGVVALSFDDGSSQLTRSLVDLLRKENVKATFFVIGKKLLDPTIAAATRYAYSAGHTIGSHTFTHRSLATSQFDPIMDPTAPKIPRGIGPLPMEALRAEMVLADLAIEAAIGVRPRLLRPPYLETTPQSLAWLETSGYVAVNINEDSNDWRLRDKPAIATPETVLSQVKAAHTAAGKAGSWILLQHELYSYSVNAVSSIIAFYRAQGLRFVTVDECLGQRPYRSRGSIPFLNDALQSKVFKGTPPASTTTTAAANSTTTAGAAGSVPTGSTAGNSNNAAATGGNALGSNPSAAGGDAKADPTAKNAAATAAFGSSSWVLFLGMLAFNI